MIDITPFYVASVWGAFRAYRAELIYDFRSKFSGISVFDIGTDALSWEEGYHLIDQLAADTSSRYGAAVNYLEYPETDSAKGIRDFKNAYVLSMLSEKDRKTYKPDYGPAEKLVQIQSAWTAPPVFRKLIESSRKGMPVSDFEDFMDDIGIEW